VKRLFFALATGLTLALSTLAAFPAHAAQTIEVFKAPACGCCGNWIEHLRKAGFDVKANEVTDLQANRKRLGMPEKFASCHTAKVGNYLIEGHVPASDIKRLLKEKPKALGLAAPGMPPGSPGMDVPNSPSYDTLLVQSDGSSKVFATH
jgi:hypothetical protein